MPAAVALCADTQLADRQRYVIADNDDALWRNIIKRGGRGNRVAREIHIGLRLDKDDFLAAENTRGGEGVEAETVDFDFLACFNPVSGHKANVVAAVIILFSGVAQKNDCPLSAAAFAFEKHIVSSPFAAIRNCQRKNGSAGTVLYARTGGYLV